MRKTVKLFYGNVNRVMGGLHVIGQLLIKDGETVDGDMKKVLLGSRGRSLEDYTICGCYLLADPNTSKEIREEVLKNIFKVFGEEGLASLKEKLEIFCNKPLQGKGGIFEGKLPL